MKKLVGLRVFLSSIATLLLVFTVVISSASAKGGIPDHHLKNPAAYQSKGNWVGTWATSPQASWGTSFKNQTIRMIIHPHLDGKALRIRLSNVFGTQPVTFGDVHVAKSAGNGAIVPGSDRQVTFDGSQSVTITNGQELKSDPVKLSVKSGQDLVVSIYVQGDSGPATWHFDSNVNVYTSNTNSGDYTTNTGVANYPNVSIYGWYFLDGVDVLANQHVKGAIVTLGDSITDGWQSTPNSNSRWPDYLASRLNHLPEGQRMSVLNEGITGNRLLLPTPLYGESALDRFNRDVLSQTGVKEVILFEGINDIGRGLNNPQAIINGMKTMIGEAHAHGLKIIGATITPDEGANAVYPGYFTSQGEAAREAVNQWIRTSGALDGVIDFDKIMRDPKDPLELNPKYDSGDHLHPSDAGYKHMGDSINLETLE